MWKNFLSFGFFILSISVSYRLIQSAHADMGPQIGLGSNPVVNFGGSVPSGGVITTAPSNQDVIITTLITNGNCSVDIDGVTMVPSSGYFNPTYLYVRSGYAGSASSFTLGTARLKVPAGSTLSLSGCTGNSYYLDGYTVHP